MWIFMIPDRTCTCNRIENGWQNFTNESNKTDVCLEWREEDQYYNGRQKWKHITQIGELHILIGLRVWGWGDQWRTRSKVGGISHGLWRQQSTWTATRTTHKRLLLRRASLWIWGRTRGRETISGEPDDKRAGVNSRGWEKWQRTGICGYTPEGVAQTRCSSTDHEKEMPRTQLDHVCTQWRHSGIYVYVYVQNV